MKAAGSATAATAEATIRAHGRRQAPLGHDKNATIVVAHEAIGMSATLRQCGHRHVQCAAIATLAAHPNPRRRLLLRQQLGTADADCCAAEQANQAEQASGFGC